MKGSFRSYGLVFLTTFAACMGAVAGINLIVDPYAVTEWVRLENFNARKPKEWDFGRLHKAFRIWKCPSEILVFGTSREERGIDPDYHALHPKGIRFYNYGLSGAELHEARSSLINVHKRQPVKKVVISLNFPFYPLKEFVRPGEYYPKEWNHFWLVSEYVRHLFSLDGLQHSVETIVANRKKIDRIEHLPHGQLNVEILGHKVIGQEYHHQFQEVCQNYLNNTLQDLVLHYHPPSAKFDHTGLIGILDYASEHSIECIFYMAPDHAATMECYHLLGLLPVYEEWKSELVSLIANHASQFPASCQPQLWDFSGYNAVTTEPVPPAGDMTHRMKWYWDPVHYKTKTGNAILNRIFQLKDPSFADLEDFGEQLTFSNFRDCLIKTRTKRENYAVQNTKMIGELAAWLDPHSRRYFSKGKIEDQTSLLTKKLTQRVFEN